MPEDVSEDKDTIQTERDHIIMPLKLWRTSWEETEIQKTKDSTRMKNHLLRAHKMYKIINW